jgi:hypothetical protein
MELVGLSFQNYKAFPGHESIEIRPLTVLIGRNSSGKSAIARLPMLLAGALSDAAESPVILEGDGVDFGGSFVELIHNQQPHGAIGLGATFEHLGEHFELSAKIQNYQEAHLAVVQELSVRIPARGQRSFTYLDENPVYAPNHYRVSIEGAITVDLALGFGGLRLDPVSFADQSDADPIRGDLVEVATVLSEMAKALSSIGYLGPFRANPQRYYRDPGGLPQSVGRSGILAPGLLGADMQKKEGVVIRAVSDWYKKYLGGWQLDMIRSGNIFSLVVRNPDKPDVAVNLVDVGAGISQVLPLIVQRKFEEITGKRGGLEIVEQPELHLHPGAHGDLADLYIEAAKHPGSRFLIETHSENFILRIRRRVAEFLRDPAKGLDPKLVHIYWVDDKEGAGSHLTKIEVLPDGEVSDWPEGVFAEDFEEVCAIREAQTTERA